MKKRLLPFLLSAMLFVTPVSIHAQNLFSTTLTTNHVMAGTKDVEIPDFTITESAPGLFEKGKTIYFQAEYLKFDTDVVCEVVSGDLKIDKVKTKDDIFSISIKSESSKEPGVIRVSGMKLSMPSALAEGSYSLKLVTKQDSQFKNNLFGETYNEDGDDGKFDVEAITVLDEFIVIDQNRDGVMVEQPITEYTVPVGSSIITIGQKQISVDVPAYQNQEGTVMLPLRAIIEGLSTQASISWDEMTKTVTIMMGSRILQFTQDSSTMLLNGTPVPMQSKMEVIDGRAFLPLRDFGHALGVPDDRIHWDESTKTASFL